MHTPGTHAIPTMPGQSDSPAEVGPNIIISVRTRSSNLVNSAQEFLVAILASSSSTHNQHDKNCWNSWDPKNWGGALAAVSRVAARAFRVRATKNGVPVPLTT
eukprot:2130148-Rhodomonas_salina.1